MQSAHLKLSLEGMGMQKVYPVNMQMTVRAYLFPFDEGIKSPIRSIEINSMGTIGLKNAPVLYRYSVLLLTWFSLFHINIYVSLPTFPVIKSF